MIARIGIDIGGTEIKAAAFDSEGSLLGTWTQPTQDAPPVNGVPVFAENVRQLLRKIDLPDALLGIATPGLVARDGRSIASNPGKMHGIEGFDWTDFLQSKRMVPVLNDAHAALLGEAWQGAARGYQNAILLTLGTGVGGAILSEGKLLKGTLGRAGHFGHASVSDDPGLGIFGVPGVLEMAIGNHTVGKRSAGRFATTRDLVTAHLAGDAEATAIWLKSVRVLARSIASFINIVDPEVVIIGGGIAKAGDALYQPLARFLDEYEWRPLNYRVRIEPAQLGEWAGAYGAAFNPELTVA